MKHVLIRDGRLNGWEYGMLRCFEEAVLKVTGASVSEMDEYQFAASYLKHFGQGMKRDHYRKYFPKKTFEVEGDIGWCILMGPENYQLDLYKNWSRKLKTKILYLYDTMPFQYPLIKRLFSGGDWDILVTSLNDSVDDLKKITGREWHCVEQAAEQSLFTPVVSARERTIHFSSYGRRDPALHEAVKSFCASKELYYDYTTHDAKHPVAESKELYRQYAWHLTHSLFTFSWPVELTNPQRAGHLHPITCRWFEAAAAGTIVLGQAPDNGLFKKLFGNDFVYNINPKDSPSGLKAQLEEVWSKKDELLNARKSYSLGGWEDRTKKILALL